ncbi:MAG: formylmethanofuran dehydrogenase subunit E family protein [Candidatus Omnitrophica bacterium]|nr:formylmethanofuran dehydrogenase subunit E family protein [Candidatus Omnitrophota bacterium]
MLKKRINLKEAIRFHGHLGPYLVLGLRAGEIALDKLKCKKYFGLRVRVFGANQKPKACLIDGLQISTGATYGKGNIKKLMGKRIKIEFVNCANLRKITLTLKDGLLKKLKETKTPNASEDLAKQLYRIKQEELFNIIG